MNQQLLSLLIVLFLVIGCSGKASKKPNLESNDFTTSDQSERHQTFTHPANMKFVYIKPGTFIMGSPADQKGRDEDEVQHEATLTTGFYMQTTEVTQGQWQLIMGDNPSHFQNCGIDCPVEQVPLKTIKKFLDRINQDNNPFNYRLPTETQWEYACRAGSTTPFSNGHLTNSYCGPDPVLDEIGWHYGNSNKRTHKVARKKPNQWGLYDMHGNVWEWCRDKLADYTLYPQTDAMGKSTAVIQLNVVRGGSWANCARSSLSANRHGVDSTIGQSHLGFRLVAVPNTDSDKDGVFDNLDKCPGTQVGIVVDETGCPDDNFPKKEDNTKWILEGLRFDTDKWNIKPEYFSVIDNVVSVMKKNQTINILISGHTDNRGTPEYNQVLSENRAKSVMEYLITKGISPGRISTIGYGLERPLVFNDKNGYPKNRRVEITIVPQQEQLP